MRFGRRKRHHFTDRSVRKFSARGLWPSGLAPEEVRFERKVSARFSGRRRHGRKTLVGVHEHNDFPAAADMRSPRRRSRTLSGSNKPKSTIRGRSAICPSQGWPGSCILAAARVRRNIVRLPLVRLPRTPLLGTANMNEASDPEACYRHGYALRAKAVGSA